MNKTLKIEKIRKGITLIDNIVYSTVNDSTGQPLELCLSLMMQHGNVESRLANGLNPSSIAEEEKKPVIVWLPGGGYRGSDKNLTVPEMTYLAEHGFCVAFVYYRGSSQALFPAQIIDVQTAIRFLRANGEKYGLLTERMGVMGRSAGGHLAALAGMNLNFGEPSELKNYSAEVQAVCNWFGPVDMPAMLEKEIRCIADNLNYRWKTLMETHPGALMGGSESDVKERSKMASPPYLLNDKVSPMLMMHGSSDRHVPCEVSRAFYEQLVAYGLESQTDFYELEGADHGSDEFYQKEVQRIVIDFFDKYLKK